MAPLVFLTPLFLALPWKSWTVRSLVVVSLLFQIGSVILPTSTEDHVAAMMRARGDVCSVWTWRCSGLWLRPTVATTALENAFSNRGLPTLEEGAAASSAVALSSSDYLAPSWWPVRIAYRLHRWSPRFGLLSSLLLLGVATVVLLGVIRGDREGRRQGEADAFSG